MSQASLDHWGVIEEQVNRSRIPRINWKNVLGMSLTRAVAKFKSAGVGAQETYDVLLFEHPEFTEEHKRKLKIGVCARFGEMETALQELKR